MNSKDTNKKGNEEKLSDRSKTKLQLQGHPTVYNNQATIPYIIANTKLISL